MKTNKIKLKIYIDYFKEIEEQILNIRKYIHFSKNNFKVYSYELLKLLQLICSEVDTVAKVLTYEDINSKRDNNITMKDWGLALQNKYREKIYVNLLFDETLTVKPFSDNWRYEKSINKNKRKCIKLCNGCKTLEWWNAYNKVKHQRVALIENDKINFGKATFKNVINAFGGLYILELLLIEKFCAGNEFESKLLHCVK